MRVVTTAGHVDHGKSTLVRMLTGMEPDRWDEERRRGLTLDLGFVWTELEDEGGATHTVAFVDVPGHHRYVGNMLAGAGAIHDALLVVAADDGWSPQSAEHLEILDLLQVGGLAVAVTKADTVDSARLAAVIEDVSARLAGTTLADAPVVAVDSVTGHGLEELRRVLVQRLMATPTIPEDGDARLWIDRSFTISGAGTVVTGTVQGGRLRTGMQVRHSPSGRMIRIRGLHALGHPVDDAPAGSRIAVNLAGVSHDDLERGDALVTGDWVETTTVDVMLQCVGDRPVTARGAWHVHLGSAELPATVHPILDSIGPLEHGPARVQLSRSVPLRYGDRLVLRDVGTQVTAAGARVLDPVPGPRTRGMLARLEAAEALDGLANADGDETRVTAFLRAHDGVAAWSRVRAVLGLVSVPKMDGVTHVGDHLVLDTHRVPWEAAAVASTEDAAPSTGIVLEDVIAAVASAGCPSPLQRLVVENLAARGALRVHDTVVTSVEDAPTYLAAREHRRSQLIAAMSVDPLQPPDLDETARRLSLRGAELRGLFDRGELVRVGEVVVTPAAIDRALDALREVFGQKPFTAAEARDAWRTTRKFAVPLLERLATTGVTSFDGEYHRLK